VNVAAFLDAAGLEGEAEGALQGRRAHRFGGRGGALTARALGGEQEPRMPVASPALAQQQEGALRQGDIAVAIALASADMDQQALSVDVVHLQVEGLAQAQPTGVDRAQRDAMVQGRHRRQDLAHLRAGEDDRQFELRGGPDQLEFGGPESLQRVASASVRESPGGPA